MTRPAAALVDVGGTLWSETWLASPEDLRAERGRRLRAAGVPAGRVEALEAALVEAVEGADDLEHLDIWSVVAAACAATGVDSLPAEAIRRAMCLPAATVTRVLPGAQTFLQTVRALGLRCVITSNGIWRDEADYWQDLRACDLAPWVDAVVSSVDTRWRKPDERFFAAALAAAAVPAGACVMVGNSEAKDVVPAAALDMATVRVAIEEEQPSRSRAQDGA